MQTNPKFAYFGTPEVAARTLEVLLAHGYRPEVVVTAPDKPQGRGLVLTPTPTKLVAEAAGVPVLTPETLTPEVALGCDLGIVVAYGKILPKEYLEQFPLGVLNIHYSLLPLYRGASPVEAAILHGDTVTGVTIQKMVYALDAGAIVAQREVSIGESETAPELRSRLIDEGAALLVETLPEYLSGASTPIEQDHDRATKCGKITKEDGLASLSDDPETLWRKYRAYAGWPGIYFFDMKDDRKVRVKITGATFSNGRFTITRVIPEGRREMAYEDYVR